MTHSATFWQGMETGACEEPCEELPAALNAAMAADGERLVEQLRLLEQMPQVRPRAEQHF